MSLPTKIENLEEIIKETIGGEVVEQIIEPLVAVGENYGSVICKVDFKVKNEEKEETYNGVAKFVLSKKLSFEAKNQQLFTAEIAWYKTIVPTITSFQQECGVEQVADFFQTFYGGRLSVDPGSRIVDNNAVVLTENLIPLGFKNIDRHVGFDLATTKAILRDLATFHAVPIAIKLKNKDLFEKNIKAYFRDFKAEQKELKNIPDIFKDFKEAFEDVPEFSLYKDRITNSIQKLIPFPTDRPIKEPWGSICHNDFWINNIMVKEAEDIKTKFLDFQTFTYDSIAADIVLFLNVSVAQKVIQEHMDEFIKYYWNEFLNNLKLLNVDIGIFTMEDFLVEIESAAFDFLGRSLLYSYMMLIDKGTSLYNSSDKNSKNEDNKSFPELTFNERHMEKYKCLILEYIKRGWI